MTILSNRFKVYKNKIIPLFSVFFLFLSVLVATNLSRQNQNISERASTNEKIPSKPLGNPIPVQVLSIYYRDADPFPKSDGTLPTMEEFRNETEISVEDATIYHGYLINDNEPQVDIINAQDFQEDNDPPQLVVSTIQTYPADSYVSSDSEIQKTSTRSIYSFEPVDTIKPSVPQDTAADYLQIIEDYDICNKVNTQGIDEVWIYGDGDGGLEESRMLGPEGQVFPHSGLSEYPNLKAPIIDNSCNKAVNIMGFNYHRFGTADDPNGYPSADAALHSLAHRFEATMSYYLDGTPWFAESGPGSNWFEYDGAGYYGEYVDEPLQHCGNAHHTPNSRGMDDAYIYDIHESVNSVVSDCNYWNPQHSGQTTVMGCEEWGCNEKGYFMRWMQNMPGQCNGMTKVNGTPMPNWWDLIFRNTANIPSCQASPTVVTIFKPTNNQVISNRAQTAFEAKAYDLTVGSSNGSGIERVKSIIRNASGTIIRDYEDTSAPYCLWGTQSPCPQMGTTIWNSLTNGAYTMTAQAKSSIDGTWSNIVETTFSISKTGPSPTPTPTPLPTPPNSRIVFITAQSYSGNLKGTYPDGLTGADAKCQINAQSAGLPGTYKAWLSTSSVDAKNRIPSDKMFILPGSGAIVANDLNDLISGDIDVAINRDQFGNIQSGDGVFTGTDEYGMRIPNKNCSNWTSVSSSLFSARGYSSDTNYGWTKHTFGGTVGCTENMPGNLYCFQTAL